MNGAEIQRMAHNLGLVHHTDQVKWLVKQILRKHKPLTKTEKVYLNHLTQPYSLIELSKHFGCTTEGARKHLKALMAKGLVDRETRYKWTEGRHGAWAWYYFKKMKDYTAGHTHWMTPIDKTPPLGSKMLLLNPGGVCVIGHWSDWAVAWAPLPKVPEHIKELL